MSQIQYQPLAGPVIVSVAAETITVDKWANEPPAPMRRRPATCLLMASMVVPVFVPAPADAPQTVDRWKATYPDAIARKTLPKAAHLVTAQNIVPIPNVTFVSGGGTIATNADQLWQYQSIAGPLDVPSTVPLVLNWQPTYPASVPAAKTLHASLQRAYQADKFDAPAAPTAPTAGWMGQGVDQVRGRTPNHHHAQAFAMDAQWSAPPQNIATTMWMPKGIDLPMKRPYARAVYTWAQPYFVIEVDVPVMSWTGWYLDPPVLRRSHRALFGTTVVQPLQLADVTAVVPPMSWNGLYPARVPAAVNSIAAKTATTVAPVFVADVAVAAPLSSARAIYPDRIYAKRSMTTGAQKSWTMDAIYQAPTAPTAPALAKPVYPDRVYARQPMAVHPDATAPNFVLDVTVPVPKLSWAPTYPDRVVVTMRHPELLPAMSFTYRPRPHFRPAWAKGSMKIYGPTRPTNPEES